MDPPADLQDDQPPPPLPTHAPSGGSQAERLARLEVLYSVVAQRITRNEQGIAGFGKAATKGLEDVNHRLDTLDDNLTGLTARIDQRDQHEQTSRQHRDTVIQRFMGYVAGALVLTVGTLLASNFDRLSQQLKANATGFGLGATVAMILALAWLAAKGGHVPPP